MKNRHKNAIQADYIPPDGAIESLARLLLPAIQAYYESEEGQQNFAEWKKQQAMVNKSEQYS